MKSIKDIVNETLAFYGGDPERRAVEGRLLCSYHTEDGRMCAVGRCMLPEYAMDTRAEGTAGCLPAMFNVPDIDELLLPEYRGHTTEFWEVLQRLHDNQAYWVGDEAAERRRKEANRITTLYGNEAA